MNNPMRMKVRPRSEDSASFTPGMGVAGVYVLIMFWIMGHVDAVWVLLSALVIMFIVDAFAGTEAVREEKVKTEQRYIRKDDE